MVPAFRETAAEPFRGRTMESVLLSYNGFNEGGAIPDAIKNLPVSIEMGASADDIALSIHPHPTLSETESEVADVFLGSATHMLSKKSTK